jgi:3-dehydroquinate synthase
VNPPLPLSEENRYSYHRIFDFLTYFNLLKGSRVYGVTADSQTMLEIVDAMDSFGTIRTEPVLVVGGGLVTDVAGYACASYRRSSNFIRVPTTLIGLIDASVSIKGKSCLLLLHLAIARLCEEM